MKIENILDALIRLIESDDYFSSVNILKAYPCSPAPSRLAGETVALGLEEIKMSSSSVDESNRAGEISVFADIFIPVKKATIGPLIFYRGFADASAFIMLFPFRLSGLQWM